MASEFYNQFYTASSPECQGELRSGIYKPSAAFEVHNHVSGIASYYRFPDGQSAADYECGIDYGSEVFSCYENPRNTNDRIHQVMQSDPMLMQRMHEDWRQLKQLNPLLDQVNVDTDNPLMLFHAIEGAACLFNPDDINFYIRDMKEGGSMAVYGNARARPEYAALFNDVAARAKPKTMQWLPAPQTLMLMKEKLDALIAPGLI